MRCDLNVPVSDGAIGDDLRIRASLPTLNTLLDKRARLVVCSHLGRPKGRRVPELSLEPVGRRLGELLRRDVTVLDEVVGPAAEKACASDDDVVVLENLRFDPGEESNDAAFAAALARLGDAYVNDAFGSSHRAHASVVGVPERLPAAAGLLLHDEVDKLERLLRDPARPFVAVLGGVKVSDKLGVVEHLLERVDTICIGGAMAFTLLVARGELVGRSLVERDRVEEVKEVLATAEERGVDVLLPSDVVAAVAPEEGARNEDVPLSEIGERVGVDIGLNTRIAFARAIGKAQTVLWNGPMGIFEIDDFAGGTKTVADAIGRATERGAYTVAGGGDSAAALAQMNLTDAVSHLSTGGGASLELLEGKDLPGLAVLRQEGRNL